ncbi:MAG: filamentous hemagglutinin N-terminal domain-containing protein, partial [Gammaproteobacteria bacterium]|nr:filamentous hemagglutinin N-terminal domain-containing protein [Gammaproteobacteria bacterium]
MRGNASFLVRDAELFSCTAGKPVLASSLVVGFTLLLSLLIYIPYTHAAPNGGNIVGGTGSINASGLTTTINQNSSSMAINWNSFDVNQHEIVNFIQPGQSSIALNQILGNNASQIHGQINANG